jgi:hypothetical protein
VHAVLGNGVDGADQQHVDVTYRVTDEERVTLVHALAHHNQYRTEHPDSDSISLGTESFSPVLRREYVAALREAGWFVDDTRRSVVQVSKPR